MNKVSGQIKKIVMISWRPASVEEKPRNTRKTRMRVEGRRIGAGKRSEVSCARLMTWSRPADQRCTWMPGYISVAFLGARGYNPGLLMGPAFINLPFA